MTRRILMALDNSKDSLKAVNYVANSVKPGTEVTMFSVLPEQSSVCSLDGPSLLPSFKERLKVYCVNEESRRQATEEFLEEARKVLLKAGFAAKDISIMLRRKKLGIAKDILNEAERGNYDTIVMGSRGLMGINKLLFGSVSHRVAKHAKKSSVIVVD